MQQGFVLWFTGGADSGRIELAECVEETLLERGMDLELLDDDMMKDDFGEGLADDRAGQDILVKRAGAIANMLSRNGVPIVIAMDAPFNTQREEIRGLVGNFVEVYCKSAKDEGIEAPEKPEILIDADEESSEDGCKKIIHTLTLLNYLGAGDGDSEYSADEEEKIKKRLKDLGYI